MPHDVTREGESSTGDPCSIEGVDQPEARPSIPWKQLAEADVEGSTTQRTRGKKVDYKHLNDPFSDEEVLQFYPHFSTFLTHVTSRAISSHATYPHAPVMCLQITGLIFAYVALTCIIVFAHIPVWFLMAVPRLLITFL
jgi:hypothetical protein